MKLAIPDPALVLLVGPSGAGKSTFAAAHFRTTEILSSDVMRAMVSDDPADQDASAEAFRMLAILVNGRLKRRLTAVIDATNLRAANRKRYQRLAGRYGIPTVAIAFHLPPQTYAAHNAARPDRIVEDEILASQATRMLDAVALLPLEGYDKVYVLRDLETVRGVDIVRG